MGVDGGGYAVVGGNRVLGVVAVLSDVLKGLLGVAIFGCSIVTVASSVGVAIRGSDIGDDKGVVVSSADLGGGGLQLRGTNFFRNFLFLNVILLEPSTQILY